MKRISKHHREETSEEIRQNQLVKEGHVEFRHSQLLIYGNALEILDNHKLHHHIVDIVFLHIHLPQIISRSTIDKL